MGNPFTDHPRAVGERYLEHLGIAGGFGSRLIVAGLASYVHAVLPFLCTTTASRAVGELNAVLTARCEMASRPPTPGAGASRAADAAETA